MQNLTQITIDSDQWEDAGKVYEVLNYIRRENSTAVELTLRLESDQIVMRVVPYHWIKWIEGA